MSVCCVDRTGRRNLCADGGTTGVSRAPTSWRCPAAPATRVAVDFSGIPTVDVDQDCSAELNNCTQLSAVYGSIGCRCAVV